MYNKLGVSLYLSNLNNINYLKRASEAGVKNLFISLHIAEEVLNSDFKSGVHKLFGVIRELGFVDVMCDISPLGIKALGIEIDTIETLKDFGVTTLRLDYGFSKDEVLKISKKINIAINASQVTREELEFYKTNNILSSIVASHNFYPLIGSGLSIAQMLEKDSLLRLYGINKIYSFIPGKANFRKTAEISYGLPTVEQHRYLDRNLSFEMLSGRFNHDIVYIGDPDFYEITSFDKVRVQAHFIKKEYLLGNCKFDTRCSDFFIRLKGTRFHQHSESGAATTQPISYIKPETCTSISRGDIFVINSNSERYKGEVLIAKNNIKDIDMTIFNKIGHALLNDDTILNIESKMTIEFDC